MSIALLIILTPLNSFGLNERFVGARPAGMGGAFAAVADDANAMNWNPAGLPMLERYEFNNVWGNQDNLGQESLYTSLIVPIVNENCALGFGWQNLKYKPISFSRGEWAFACARRMGKWSLGGNGRSVYRNIKQQADKEMGFKLDAGALWFPCNTLRLALVKYGIFGTELQKEEPIRYKTGLCYHPPGNKNLLFALDKDNLDTHWGIEFLLRKPILKTTVALRMGSNQSKGITLKQANALGANLLQFDYALSGDDSYSAVSLGYEYITSMFNLRGVSFDPFFSNLYICTYKSLENGKIPLGIITVENKMQNAAMDVWATIDMKEYTDNKAVPLKMELSLERTTAVGSKQPAVGSSSIQPLGTSTGSGTSATSGTAAGRLVQSKGETTSPLHGTTRMPSIFERLVHKQAGPLEEVAGKEALDRCTIPPGYIARIKMINLPLSGNILKVKGNVSVSPEIKLYYILRDEVRDITPKCGNVNICGHNGTGTYQVNWNQAGMIATFMTIKEDSFMADFMGEVKRCYLKTKELAVFPQGLPENVFKAMYLFDVLKVWGITYTERRDYRTGAPKDTYLRCPDEMLCGRFTNGNDEDLSVLLAACLKYWDIPAGFLDGGPAKKENFMPLFSTGIPAENGTNTIGYNDVFLFNPEWDKNATWLPLRTPKWKDNFIILCQQGIGCYKGEEDGKKAREEYKFKAVFLPEESNFSPSMPVKERGEKGLVFSDKLWMRIYEEFRMDIQKFNEISSYKNFFGEVKIEPLPDSVKSGK